MTEIPVFASSSHNSSVSPSGFEYSIIYTHLGVGLGTDSDF